MKFVSVKQAVKFGIEADLPPDKQLNLSKDCKMSKYLTPPRPAGINNSIK
jgi:hypothetical protein